MNVFEIIYYKTVFVIPLFLILTLIINIMLKYFTYGKTIFLSGIFILLYTFIELYYLGIHNSYEWVTTGDIPILLRLLDENYLKNDFYTNSISSSAKVVFYYIIYIFINIFNINTDSSLFLFKNIQNFLIPFLTFYILIFNIKLNNKIILSILISLILIFCLGYLNFISIIANIGIDSFTNWKNLSPQSFSFTFGLFGLLLLQRNFKLSSGIVFFISSLIHPIVAIIFLSTVVIITENNNSKNFFINNLIKINKLKYFLIFSFIIPAIFITSFFKISIPENFIEIYVYERHPHHYLLSSFFNIFSFMYVLVPLFFYFVARYFNAHNNKILSINIFLFVILCLIAQYLAVEIFNLEYIILLGPTRLLSVSVFLYIFLFCQTCNSINFNDK